MAGALQLPELALLRALSADGRLLLSLGWLSASFFLGGALTIGYDLTLHASFRALGRPRSSRNGG